MVVKELLQLLVREVDTQLLEPIQLKDLKAGNVQHTNKVLPPRPLHVQRLIDAFHQPTKATAVDRFAQ